jgi:MYXO-CTERM domain-containing protein
MRTLSRLTWLVAASISALALADGVPRNALTGGGVSTSDAGLELRGAIGQPATNVLTGGSFTVIGGFLPRLEAVTTADGGAGDAGTVDAGVSDAGLADAGAPDAGAADAGGTDAGGTDAGGTDAGGADAGGADAGGADAGGADAGAEDAGSPGAPRLTSITPNHGKAGEATPVVVLGAAFVPSTQVIIGGGLLSAATFSSAAVISGTVPATLAPGTYDVVVANPDGQTATLARGFTVDQADAVDAGNGTGKGSCGCTTGGGEFQLLFTLLAALTWRRRR